MEKRLRTQPARADIERHAAFWQGFTRFLMISIAATVLTLALMAIFLV